MLSRGETEKLKTMFDGEMKLAFLLFIYTGARRGEICQYQLGDGSGLRWKNVLWMQGLIRLLGKGKERLTPLVERLKEALTAEMRDRQARGEFDPEDLVACRGYRNGENTGSSKEDWRLHEGQCGAYFKTYRRY